MNSFETPLYPIDYNLQGNRFFIKRDDLFPFSFGGNKARKAVYFFREFENGNYDCIVTYGSSSSNHCRVIANYAAHHNIPCYIISPEEASAKTFNSTLVDMMGAKRIVVPVVCVKETIDNILASLKFQGKTPYFIPGGGHGYWGTKAYVDCYKSIHDFEQNNGLKFDYIFFASGTGTTHAGLVCGKLIYSDSSQIVGISIARNISRGVPVILESIEDFLKAENLYIDETILKDNIKFIDDFIGCGYAESNVEIDCFIKEMFIDTGIPLDSTYTGKAFWGMTEYIRNNNISGKNVLFIHTGGTPLFFDDLARI